MSKITLSLILFALPIAAASAQTPVFSVDVNRVYLEISVRDRLSESPIQNLDVTNFLVLEDGAKQRLEFFSPVEQPFTVLMLLDLSGSSHNYLPLIRRAAASFVTGARVQDKIGLLTFRSQTAIYKPPTIERPRIADELKTLEASGQTAFYDALWTALDHLRDVEGRKAIVAFTDGRDNASVRHTYKELYERLAASEVVVYTIHLETEGQTLGQGSLSGSATGRSPNRTARDVLSEPRFGQSSRGGLAPAASVPVGPRAQLITMVEATGGRFYAPNRYDDVEDFYDEIAGDLRSFYSLAYSSSNSQYDGAWRDILVLVSGAERAEARTRKGYWGTPRSR
jgi:VWFA-related protein